MNILLLDNYDSFTWNLAHLIGALGHEVRVHRNDSLTPEEALAASPDAIVISPGPCSPNEAGISLALVAAAAEAAVPLLGVCLGHQSICQVYGATVTRAKRQMHGKTSPMLHEGRGLFSGLPSPFVAARYHSLSVPEDTTPDTLEVTARAADDGEVMAVSVRGAEIHGLQFHPESIASHDGARIVTNFLARIPAGKVAA